MSADILEMNKGGRPQGSKYLEALAVLGGRATVYNLQKALHDMGLEPVIATVYQRMKQLEAEGRVVADGPGVFRLPDNAATATNDRMDELLAELVRRGVLPYDHGI